jgi:hypothetical protein
VKEFFLKLFPRPYGLGSIILPLRGFWSFGADISCQSLILLLNAALKPHFRRIGIQQFENCSEKAWDSQTAQAQARQGGIIEPTATGVPGKPVFGLLGQVSGGYGEKKVQAPL